MGLCSHAFGVQELHYHFQEYQIDHFQVPLCLCFKMSPCAKPFLWKRVWFTWKWTCRQNSFSYEWFCAKTHLTQRQKANRKWPIPFITICLGLPVLMSNSFSWRLASRCKDIGKETSTELVKISQSKNLVLPHPTFPCTRCSCKILHWINKMLIAG